MVSYFPAVCIDNFFNDPDYVLDLAKNSAYEKIQANYPGSRSNFIHELDPVLFDTICSKIFSVFYSHKIPPEITWSVQMTFQRIDPFPNQELYYPDGWVHADDVPMAGVIYLNKNDINAGTSLYTPKTFLTSPKNGDIKEAFYSGQLTDVDVYNKAIEENNLNFEETVSFKSKFNRLVMYDGYHMHGAKNLLRLSEPRYTIVFFVMMANAPHFPLQSVRLHKI